MKAKSKYTSSLHDAIAPVLQSGSKEEIALTRKNYWRAYKANWRKQKRSVQKEFTVSLTKKELQIIASASKKHHRSRTRFIKEAALAYCTGEVLIPDQEVVNQLRELLLLNYNVLQQRVDNAPLLENEPTLLLNRMAAIEQQVLTMLQNPKKLNLTTIE